MLKLIVPYGIGVLIWTAACLGRLFYSTSELDDHRAKLGRNQKREPNKYNTRKSIDYDIDYEKRKVVQHKREIVVAWRWLRWAPLWPVRGLGWCLRWAWVGLKKFRNWITDDIMPVVLEDLDKRPGGYRQRKPTPQDRRD